MGAWGWRQEPGLSKKERMLLWHSVKVNGTDRRIRTKCHHYPIGQKMRPRRLISSAKLAPTVHPRLFAGWEQRWGVRAAVLDLSCERRAG